MYRQGYYFLTITPLNAYATSEAVSTSIPDGAVYFGYRLYSMMYARPKGRSIVRSILAHEWGHLLQFKKRMAGDWTVQHELSADYMSGWYLGKLGEPEDNIGGIKDAFSSFGDADYLNKDHHGTPMQRAAMFELALGQYRNNTVGIDVKSRLGLDEALAQSYGTVGSPF